jgi:hypothetical protein
MCFNMQLKLKQKSESGESFRREILLNFSIN